MRITRTPRTEEGSQTSSAVKRSLGCLLAVVLAYPVLIIIAFGLPLVLGGIVAVVLPIIAARLFPRHTLTAAGLVNVLTWQIISWVAWYVGPRPGTSGNWLAEFGFGVLL